MTGFALDSNGDVIISHGAIQMINGDELIRQTVETVLGTNKGEWFLNTEEGIDFYNILGRNKEEDIIKNEVMQGLRQVDSSFIMDSFSFTQSGRSLSVHFTAKTESGEVIEGASTWD